MEASLHACSILTFPCVHLLLADLYWFPPTPTLHSLPCKWQLGELMDKRNVEKASHRQVRINWNGHSSVTAPSLKLSSLSNTSNSTAFTNRNHHMWLGFHFLPWVGNLRWWKPEPVLLYFFFLTHIQLSSCLFLCYDGTWSWGSM